MARVVAAATQTVDVMLMGMGLMGLSRVLCRPGWLGHTSI